MEPESILTPEEMESMRTVQTLYGAQAKLAANSLSETLGLAEETQEEFVGRVAIGLEGLDFERRKHVADLFIELTHCLDTDAQDDAPKPSGMPVFVPIAAGEPPSPTAPSAQLPPAPVHEAASQNGNSAHTPHEASKITESAEQHLPKPQSTWLEKLLGEEGGTRVASLSMSERIEFAQQLGDAYVNLKITPLSKEDKQKRSQQMFAFIGEGKSYKEIAEQEDVAIQTLRMGIDKMVKSIGTRMEMTELVALIPEKDSVAEAATQNGSVTEDLTDNAQEQMHQNEEDIEPQELSKLQRNWFVKVFGEERFGPSTIKTIESLSATQRMNLSSKLNKHIQVHGVKRDGVHVNGRKQDEVAMLIQGKTVDEICLAVRRPEVAVKEELHAAAMTINAKVSIEELRSMLTGAAESQ